MHQNTSMHFSVPAPLNYMPVSIRIWSSSNTLASGVDRLGYLFFSRISCPDTLLMESLQSFSFYFLTYFLFSHPFVFLHLSHFPFIMCWMAASLSAEWLVVTPGVSHRYLSTSFPTPWLCIYLFILSFHKVRTISFVKTAMQHGDSKWTFEIIICNYSAPRS